MSFQELHIPNSDWEGSLEIDLHTNYYMVWLYQNWGVHLLKNSWIDWERALTHYVL